MSLLLCKNKHHLFFSYGFCGWHFHFLCRIFNTKRVLLKIDDMNGSGWTVLGSFGSGDNQFNKPYGITVFNKEVL